MHPLLFQTETYTICLNIFMYSETKVAVKSDKIYSLFLKTSCTYNLAKSGRFLQWCIWRHLHYLSDLTETFLTIIILQRWHTSYKLQLELVRNENVIAQKRVTNWYKMHSISSYSTGHYWIDKICGCVAVALRLRCGSCKLNLWHFFIIFC